jgi:hypothetical protein
VTSLGFRHPGGRLVEQQHARPARERHRDFQEPLLAVRQRRGALRHDIDEAEPFQQLRHLGRDAGPAADDAPPVAAGAVALGDREAERLDRRQVGEQLIDLEGAGDAEAHALVRLEPGDRRAVEQDVAARWAQHAGEQVDEGGLAGAVGADQGVAGALANRDRDRIRRHDAAEPLVETAGFKHGRFRSLRHGHTPLSGFAAEAERRSSRIGSISTKLIQPPMRSRPMITMATRRSPIQNCQ